MTETVIASLTRRFATAREIMAQPEIWRSFAPELDRQRVEIREWIERLNPEEIWFCGAGTSAYIGEVLAAQLDGLSGAPRFRAIATTDFVASPLRHLRPGLRPLVVSFGRSGDSSESIGMLRLLDALCPAANRLHITCNANGKLATAEHPGPGELRVITLPPETEDKGFAMTSSFTTMLLTALSCFDTLEDKPSQRIAVLADAATSCLANGAAQLSNIAPPARAVFLGSGPLKAIAREAGLKVLELTAGHVTTSWDSPLGFRHGPKSVVDNDTLVVLFPSNDPYCRRYEDDAAEEIRAQFGRERLIHTGGFTGSGHDAWDGVVHVLTAQLLALFWSNAHGLAVDDPFAGRNLTRIVSGVTLYPPPAQPPATRHARFAGIDVGGSKIESVLFDAGFNRLSEVRVTVRKENYDALLDQIVEQVEWLSQQAGQELPIGIGLPGIAMGPDGLAFTANLPATGRPLVGDIRRRAGRPLSFINDCKAFALSEARGGAGMGHATVFGLILGTGIGGGLVRDGELAQGLNGLAGEVGHIGIPNELMHELGLPVLACGCGRSGCFETLASGPGLARIARMTTGLDLSAEEVATRATYDAAAAYTLDLWTKLLAELLYILQLTCDPDVVVLGGGMSRIADLVPRLQRAFESRAMENTKPARIEVARFGDDSGVRGAAILAADQLKER